MIVYSGTKKSFIRDVSDKVVARKLDSLFVELGLGKESRPEFESWKRSLPQIGSIISDNDIDENVKVALEYQIPLTSKRVDFMIGGSYENKDNVVIVELKQWETCSITDKENVVNAFTAGDYRDVAHPSQQAYSYAKLIEHFNESVRENNIGLIPCAYLHNFKEVNRRYLCDSKYSEAIADAPVFLENDGSKLTDFIKGYVRKPSQKDLFDIIENGKLKPSKALQDAVGSILNGNREFEMIDEQLVAYSTVLKLVEQASDDQRKHTIIVKGGPGTGKSVIAINLLAKIINNNYSCYYVTKTSAPRFAFSQSLIRGKHSLSYLRGLFRSAGTFYEENPNTYDCLIVDEAHRLNLKSGFRSNLGENQIKEIINACRISVFFIDEDQMVTTRDIGTVDEIKRQAAALGSIIHCNKNLELVSQFRCNGSDGYLAFLDDLLQLRKTANKDFDMDYDLEIFDSPTRMREALRPLNANNKARMIAGYCYEWNSKDDKSKMDIVLPDGFEAQWNLTTNSFAVEKDSFEQVGCIHSTQGLEFDYVGIIIGKDLICRNGKVITDRSAIAKSDYSSGIRRCKDPIRADRLIRNTYKVLLSRGQKGCFVYCEDEELRNLLKKAIRRQKESREKLKSLESSL